MTNQKRIKLLTRSKYPKAGEDPMGTILLDQGKYPEGKRISIPQTGY